MRKSLSYVYSMVVICLMVFSPSIYASPAGLGFVDGDFAIESAVIPALVVAEVLDTDDPINLILFVPGTITEVSLRANLSYLPYAATGHRFSKLTKEGFEPPEIGWRS